MTRESGGESKERSLLPKVNALFLQAASVWLERAFHSWVKGVTQPGDDCSLSKLDDHIDHICQIAGNAKHCGIGSDLDGGFGKEQSPSDLDTIADLDKLAGILTTRGYSAEDVEGIMYKNWINFFRRAWGG